MADPLPPFLRKLNRMPPPLELTNDQLHEEQVVLQNYAGAKWQAYEEKEEILQKAYQLLTLEHQRQLEELTKRKDAEIAALKNRLANQAQNLENHLANAKLICHAMENALNEHLEINHGN